MKKLLLAGAMLLASMTAAFAEPVKAGFIYVGPIGDHGWTYRHDIGRQQVEEAFGDQVETVYLEKVHSMVLKLKPLFVKWPKVV